MQYVTTCPFRVATVLWQASPGAWTLTTCVKITYALVHEGEATVAEEQDPVEGPRTWDDAPRASLRAPGDYAPIKRRVDVLVTGHAFAPPGRGPVESLVARYRIGELGKALRVVGDRVWTPTGGALWPSAPIPFLSMPLRWERAARTVDNPVGVDPSRPPVAGAPALPNLELADGDPSEDRVAGFGPMAPDGPARRALLAPEAWAWAQGFRSGAAVHDPTPRGFDFRFFNAAPADQQVDALRATATIVLEHLHPRHARLVTRLPPVRPRLTHEARGVRTEVGLRCDTLVIDTDRAVAIVSWRGSTEVPGADARELGRLAIGAEANGQAIRFPGFERGVVLEESAPGSRLDAAPRPPVGSSPRFGPPPAIAQRAEEARHAPASVPFAPPPVTFTPPIVPRPAARGPQVDPPTRPKWSDRPRLDTPPLDPDDRTIALVRPSIDADHRARAVAVAIEPAEAATAAELATEGSIPTRTDLVVRPLTIEALPSSPTLEAPPSAPAHARLDALHEDAPRTVTARRRLDAAESTREIRLDALVRHATPFEGAPDDPASSPPPEAPAPPPPAPGVRRASWDDPAAAAEPPPTRPSVLPSTAPPPPAIEPPPMIGPIQPTAPTTATVTPLEPEIAPEGADEGPRDLALEEYARVRARLALQPGEREAHFLAERLTDRSWRAIDDRWLAAIGAETRRGRSKLLARFDDAYVAEQEALRGPMSVAQYARLAAALEFGAVDPVLTELALDRADLMRLTRVWTRRTLADPALAAELRRALAAARAE